MIEIVDREHGEKVFIGFWFKKSLDLLVIAHRLLVTYFADVFNESLFQVISSVAATTARCDF
jgi:hypothetical protein